MLVQWWDHGLISDLISHPGKVSKQEKRRSEKRVKMQALGMNKPYRSEVLSCLYVNKINIDTASDFADCPWHWLILSVPVTNSLLQDKTSSCLAPLRHWFPAVLHLVKILVSEPTAFNCTGFDGWALFAAALSRLLRHLWSLLLCTWSAKENHQQDATFLADFLADATF